MQVLWEKLLVSVALFSIGIALELPPEFRKCKRSGDDINECLKGAIQDSLPMFEKGLPELNIPSFQPINIPEASIGEGKGGAVQLVQNFKDIKIYDVPHAKIDKLDAKITDTGFDIIIDAFLSEIKIEADYEFNGRILALPIVGNGPSVVIFKDAKAHVTMHAEVFQKKGQNYTEIKDFKVTLTPGNINFNFMNLFNGEKRLGDEMNKVMTDNWKGIWEEVGVGYEELVALVIKNITNLIFKRVPFEQIFPK